jgi:hypothetical protein
VNALRPDLVAVTGDLVDGSVRHLADDVAPLGELRARLGVYFVTGNHDHYSGADAWAGMARSLGMRVLRNERVAIEDRGAAFDLAGVEDHHARPRGGTARRGPARGGARSRAGDLCWPDPRLQAGVAPGRGSSSRGTRTAGDLSVRSWSASEFRSWRVSRAAPGSYVTGTGFWGPPMRLLAPAEITELVLRAPGGAAGDSR